MTDNATTEESSDHTTTEQLRDPAFLSDLRAQMLRFAVLQLSDEQLAEDAVQEALAGALRNAGSFSRRSALKTWVFAILRNKIADTLRQRQRRAEATRLTQEEEEEEDLETLFDARGHWQAEEAPLAWSEPAEALKNDEFWLVFEACLGGLPDRLARVFMMREFLELGSAEICETMGTTVSNHHVMLYRARLRLRECLENRWFLEGER